MCIDSFVSFLRLAPTCFSICLVYHVSRVVPRTWSGYAHNNHAWYMCAINMCYSPAITLQNMSNLVHNCKSNMRSALINSRINYQGSTLAHIRNILMALIVVMCTYVLSCGNKDFHKKVLAFYM